MSPILVRPVREQFEHDRVIRLLQAKFRRRFDVGINPGSEQNVPVGTGSSVVYPDVVLTSADRGRRVQAVIEVETGESVNNLEALAQWALLGRLRPAFHLYVPVISVDVAKRLCTDHHVAVAEIQSYHTVGDQMRFTPVYKAPADSHLRGSRNEPRTRRPAKVSKVAAARRPTAKASAPGRKAARKPSRIQKHK